MAMAPPRNRRPGYNRKAQYGLFAAYLVAVAGVAGALLLLVISAIDPQGFSALRAMASEIISPVARTVDAGRRTVTGLFENAGAYLDAASKNRALSEEAKRLRTRAIEADALERENRRLRGLLAIPADSQPPVARGRLIGITGSSARRIALLSVGAAAGVRSGMTLAAPEGLVGRVLEVSPTTAKVLLITDPDNVVPVRRVGDGQPAFASGLSDGTIAVKAISFGVNPFKKGDIVVTSGSGGIYQPNTPVARIIRTSREGAIAVPLADPAGIDFVDVRPPFSPAAIQAEASAPPPAAE